LLSPTVWHCRPPLQTNFWSIPSCLATDIMSFDSLYRSSTYTENKIN
jgi:hypothetical protein